MKTITFYSYKGGVGRSLLVANAAKYLSTLGKSVFAIDLDLEAPGLHYKFELDAEIKRSAAVSGVADVLSHFISKNEIPESLQSFVSGVRVVDKAGSINLMRAGKAPKGEYWRTLSQINWYEIFYGIQPTGAPFFLELKERIRSEFAPDFLLIDARTGITEMGGLATTLLPDTVVCLGLSSLEHLEGLRAVMRGISRAATRSGVSLKLLPVISRLVSHKNEEAELVRLLKYFTEGEAHEDGRPFIDEVFSLHSESLLEKEEQLLIGGKNSPFEIPLLRDYLRLFSKIIPTEDIRPFVGKLIQQAISRLLDDPDTAQSDLETLTAYCADQEAYRALIKLYQVRKVAPDKILATASLMWQLRSERRDPDSVLVEIVRSMYVDRPSEMQKKYADFADSVWKESGIRDARVTLGIANSLYPEHKDRAISLLFRFLDTTDEPTSTVVARLIDLLRSESDNRGIDIVGRFKSRISSSDFLISWTKLVISKDDAALAEQTFADEDFHFSTLQLVDPVSGFRLLRLAGGDANDFLREALDSAVTSENMSLIRSLSEVFLEVGDPDELEYRLSRHLAPKIVHEILALVRRRNKRPQSLGYLERFSSPTVK